jgi:hypothetical protein
MNCETYTVQQDHIILADVPLLIAPFPKYTRQFR